MMRSLFLFFVAFLSLETGAFAQKVEPLSVLAKSATAPADQAVVYGSFIQRLGFSSGGLAQTIWIMNRETQELYSFRVKPAFKSAKENMFCCVVPPGTYDIVMYVWGKSKWWGVTTYKEPIYKKIDIWDKDTQAKIASGEIPAESLQRFSFSVGAGAVHYLGVWHFDSGYVSFTDGKMQDDQVFADKYKKLDFSRSILALPD